MKRRIHNRRSLWGNIIAMLFLLSLSAFMLFPMVFVINNAFKPLDELFLYPPRLFVRNPTTENFIDLLQVMSQSWVPFSRYLMNTVALTVLGTAGHLFLASMAAFVLAKYAIPGGRVIFRLIVLSLMFSGAVTFVPTYIMMSKLHLLDTFGAMVLPALQYSLGLYLMKQFIEGVPDAVMEAAEIDGASVFTTYWHVVMPMVKPAWLTLIILMIQNLWNQSPPYIYSEQHKTLPQAMNQILAGGVARTGVASAIAIVLMVVPLVTFVLSQSSVIETMNASGIKE
jgi:ABC-type glycerol-3-phosphate transport system permease component